MKRSLRTVERPTELLIRHAAVARVNHWITGGCFVLLLLSGLSMFHPMLFWLSNLFGGGQWTRAVHPWIGIVLVVSYAGMIVQFWRDNLPSRDDVAWTRALPQVLQNEEAGVPEVPRFNTGAISKDTTHISVLDKDGNCFTMTHSLGMPSGVITPGLGFMYNGCMGVFDPRPGRAGSIAPGKARFSSVVPSIVFKDGKPHLIIGAPGATQIAMGVLHVILNALDFDMTMVEAVSAPRFSATSDAIDISNRIQFRVERELKEQGYPVVRSPYGFGFAAVHGIRVHEDGLDGGADPGHDGVVIAV